MRQNDIAGIVMNADYEGLAGLVHVAHHLFDPLAGWNLVQRRDTAMVNLCVRIGYRHEKPDEQRDQNGFVRIQGRLPLSVSGLHTRPNRNVRFPPIAAIGEPGEGMWGGTMNETGDWSRLTDAYGDTYDPRPALAAIAHGNAAEGFDELWQRAHHQGDLGTAAYAIVPELVRWMADGVEPDWRAYALIATIEERRKAERNPAIPEWLARAYETAMREVVQPALTHLRSADGDAEVRSLLAVLAHAKGQPTIGAIALWTEDERSEALGEL